MKRRIIYIILLIIFLAAGIEIGLNIPKKNIADENKLIEKNKENTFQAGWDAARKKLAEKGFGGQITMVTGVTDSITNNSLVLKNVSTSDPLLDPYLETRTVKIDSNTKIYFNAPKDSQQYQKEVEEYNQQVVKQQDQQLTPPTSFDKKEITLSEIKQSQTVSVKADSNIAEQKEFTATEINVQQI